MNLLIIRLIIFVLLFWAGLKLYRMYREWQADREGLDRDSPPTSERMVRCAYCRLHLPESESIHHEALTFCCREHRARFLEHGPARENDSER
ncbi:PP0621 family protein [Halomonas shantousis]